MVVELSLNFADLHEQIEMLFPESGFIVVMECPLWVKSGHSGPQMRCPLYPKSGHWNSAVKCPLCAKSRRRLGD